MCVIFNKSWISGERERIELLSERRVPNAKVEKEKGKEYSSGTTKAMAGGDYAGPMITKMKNSNRYRALRSHRIPLQQKHTCGLLLKPPPLPYIPPAFELPSCCPARRNAAGLLML